MMKKTNQKCVWLKTFNINLAVVFLVVSAIGATLVKGEDSTDLKVIETIQVEKYSVDETRVAFKLNGQHVPKHFAISGEKPRIVCDFPGAKLGSNIKSPIEVDDDILRRIRIGIHKSPTPKVRVVLDLEKPLNAYSAKQAFFKVNNYFVIFIKLK